MKYLLDDEHVYVNVGNEKHDLFVCRRCAITSLSASATIYNVPVSCVN